MAYGTVQTALASAAQTASGNGPTNNTQSGQYGVDSKLNLTVNLSAFAGGTAPSLTVSVQWSTDDATWATADPDDTFAAVTVASSIVKQFIVKAPFYRVVWTTAGAPTSVTFDVSGYITR